MDPEAAFLDETVSLLCDVGFRFSQACVFAHRLALACSCQAELNVLVHRIRAWESERRTKALRFHDVPDLAHRKMSRDLYGDVYDPDQRRLF